MSKLLMIATDVVAGEEVQETLTDKITAFGDKWVGAVVVIGVIVIAGVLLYKKFKK